MRSTGSWSKRGCVSASRSRSKPSVLAVAQNLERAANLVTAGPEGQLDRVALAPRLERLGVEIAGALVEQGRHHVGDTGLADRILVGAALERKFHRDQRHRRLAHQPGFDPARADHPLDLGHRLRLRRAQKQGADGNSGKRRRYAACEKTVGDHERRLLRLGVLLDQISGDRAALVEPGLRGVAHLFRRDLLNAVRPGLEMIDGKSRGQRAAIPARHGGLTVLRIDHIGHELDLGAFEFVVGDAVLGDLGDHRIHRLFEILQRHIAARRAVDTEARAVERGALVPGADRGRHRLLDHQLGIEPAVVTAAENLRQHFQRFGFAGLRSWPPKARGSCAAGSAASRADRRRSRCGPNAAPAPAGACADRSRRAARSCRRSLRRAP